MNDSFIVLDNTLVVVTSPQIDALAPGRLRARGVFETMRVIDGKIVFWKYHWQRIKRSLDFLKIKIPINELMVKKSAKLLAHKNHLKKMRLRLSVWRDGEIVRWSLIGQPLQNPEPEHYRQGWSLGVFPQLRQVTRTSHHKMIDYLYFLEALVWARDHGFDEALIINTDNHVVEGSRTNIFWVHNDQIFFPANSCGPLKGTMRQHVIELAKASGFKLRPIKAKLENVLAANEVFVTNAVMGIMPVAKINTKSYLPLFPESMTTTLSARISELMRKSLRE